MPSTGPQDVIFCKNVTIYFRADVTRKLIRGIHDTLAPGGYLLLGHAESLWQMSDGFSLVEHGRAFCYRKISQVSQKVAAPGSAAPKVATQRLPPRKPKEPPAAHITSQYEVCLATFRAGDWDAAEAGLGSLTAACPTFVPALLLLGGLYAQRGRLEDALRQAESVLKLTDLEPRAHLLLGMIAARQQRTDEALQSLRRSLYLDDSLALAHFWLGNLYRDRGDTARACQEYENVVRDWDRHTLELTEEFSSELSAEQLVSFCRDSLERLQPATVNTKR
jgi:chemotaxis protein methyltransferase CheR